MSLDTADAFMDALSLPKGTSDPLVPNQIPMLIEVYGFLLILSGSC